MSENKPAPRIDGLERHLTMADRIRRNRVFYERMSALAPGDYLEMERGLSINTFRSRLREWRAWHRRRFGEDPPKVTTKRFDYYHEDGAEKCWRVWRVGMWTERERELIRERSKAVG